MKNVFKASLVALALASATTANAATLAITNAKVHTVTDAGVLENATVIVEDGVITAINPESFSADSAEVIDAKGKVLTPGFIVSLDNLGLVEVGAVARSRDAGDKKANITFDPSVAFNPKSTVIPMTRKGGITQAIVTPSGGDDIFAGQTFVANLSGQFDSVEAAGNAVVVELGSESKGSRASAILKLTEQLEDAQKALDKAAKANKEDKKEGKEPKRSEKVLNAVLNGEKPLVAHADRATDILALLKLKEQFGFELVLAGAADAILIADKIAAAKVPVVMNSMRNLPGSFDSLHVDLTSAGVLSKAGVKVVLTTNGDTHNGHLLRFTVGNAVANGMDYDAALAAVTANVAEVFKLDSGSIAKGKPANLVLWGADPFELSTSAEMLWIDGKLQKLESRQDALRDRYMTKSDMPRGYTK
ncbi:amidohydrolase family protein [Thalassotalea euphylliae]|uniref:amidohydrolase family protein n=1 Tax=Thalassotalea euphylliae TaxID=1655234 RepID=UPI003637D151